MKKALIALFISMVALTQITCNSDKPTESNSRPSIQSVEIRFNDQLLTPSQLHNIPIGSELSLKCNAIDANNDRLHYNWSGNIGLFNRTDSSYVIWQAPDTGANAIITVVVSDDESSITDTTELTIVSRAVLALGSVSPGHGDISQNFVYEVTYIDPLGNAPNKASVIIDNDTLTMNYISEDSVGALYRLEASLPAGSHRYYFYFTDSDDSSLYFPEDAYSIGPQVSSNSEIIINEDVIIVDDFHDISLINIDSNVYTFQYQDLQPHFETGDIIVGTEGNGYLRRISGINIIGDQVIIETVEASLNEAIESCTVDTLISLNGVKEFNSLPMKKCYTLERSGEIFESVEVTACYDYDIGYAVYIVIANGRIEEFYSHADGTVMFSGNVVASSSKEFNPDSLETASLELFSKPVLIMIGHLPFILTIDLDVVAGMEFDAKAAISLGAGFQCSASGRIGAHWYDDDWHEIWDPDTPNYEILYPSVTIDGELKIRTYVKPKLAFMIYGQAGPYLEIYPFLDFKGNFSLISEPPYYECKWGFYWGIGANLGFQIRKLDKDVPVFDPLHWEWPSEPESILVVYCNRPHIVSTTPEDSAINVPVNTTITATFSEEMDPDSITLSHFTVSDGDIDILGEVSYDNVNKKTIFTPSDPLDYDTEYYATISGNVADLNGVTMGPDYDWTFRTAPNVPLWNFIFTFDPSRIIIDTCQESSLCQTHCPQHGELWFFEYYSQLLWPAIEMDIGEGTINHTSCCWFGECSSFDYGNATLDITGTYVNNLYSFQMVVSGEGDYKLDDFLFESPGPFQMTFTVTDAVYANDQITGDFSMTGHIGTPEGNCIFLSFTEIHDGTVVIDVTEPAAKRALNDLISIERQDIYTNQATYRPSIKK